MGTVVNSLSLHRKQVLINKWTVIISSHQKRWTQQHHNAVAVTTYCGMFYTFSKQQNAFVASSMELTLLFCISNHFQFITVTMTGTFVRQVADKSLVRRITSNLQSISTYRTNATLFLPSLYWFFRKIVKLFKPVYLDVGADNRCLQTPW